MTAGLLLALALLPASGQTASGRTFGLLLLGEGGGPAWQEAVDAVKKRAAGRYPVEFAEGDAELGSIQKAVDALQAKHVEKIVAVPLFLSSYSDVMDQNRYLFGIRETPSANIVGKPGEAGRMASPRVKSKVPLVLTNALDDQPAVVDTVALHARALTRDPAKATLVVVGATPETKEGAREWVAAVSALTEKARQRGGFARGQAMALRVDQRPEQRDSSEREVKEAIRTLRRGGEVVVVPLELSSDFVARRLKGMLQDMFVRFDGKPILPDPKIVDWVDQSAVSAAKLPDMRQFKERPGPGKPGAGAPRLDNQPKMPSMPPLRSAKPSKENDYK